MDQGISPKLKNITSIVAGTSGQFLQTQGPGPSPIWANAVTSITAGTGLTGGPITTTGTISVGTSGVTAGTYQFGNFTVNNLGFVTQATAGTPVTSIVTGTGLTGGTITSTGTIAIGTSGVTAGTYQGLVVNTLGQVTSASNQSYGTGSVTSIIAGTNLTGGTITGTGTIALATAPTVTGIMTASSFIGTSYSTAGIINNNTGGTLLSSTLTSLIDSTFGSAQGDILYRNSSAWVVLTPGTSGYVLQTGGTAGNTSWVASSGGGSVTSVATGTGLTGGPITTSGTISIGTSGVTAGTYLGLTVNALGQITAESALTVSKQFSYIGTAANGTIQLDTYAPYAYTITEVYGIACTAGSATAAIQINGTNVTGLSSISVNTTGTNYAASGANSVSVGNTVTLVLTSATTGVNLQFTLAASRTT